MKLQLQMLQAGNVDTLSNLGGGNETQNVQVSTFLDTGGLNSPKSHMVQGTLYTKGETGNSGAIKPTTSGGATQSNLGYLSAVEKDADSPLMRTPNKLKLSVQKNLTTNKNKKDNGSVEERTEDVVTEQVKRRK